MDKAVRVWWKKSVGAARPLIHFLGLLFRGMFSPGLLIPLSAEKDTDHVRHPPFWENASNEHRWLVFSYRRGEPWSPYAWRVSVTIEARGRRVQCWLGLRKSPTPIPVNWIILYGGCPYWEMVLPRMEIRKKEGRRRRGRRPERPFSAPLSVIHSFYTSVSLLVLPSFVL